MNMIINTGRGGDENDRRDVEATLTEHWNGAVTAVSNGVSPGKLCVTFDASRVSPSIFTHYVRTKGWAA